MTTPKKAVTPQRDIVLSLVLGTIILACLMLVSLLTDSDDTPFAALLGGAMTMALVAGALIRRFARRG